MYPGSQCTSACILLPSRIGSGNQLHAFRVHIIGIHAVPIFDIIQLFQLIQQDISRPFLSVLAGLDHNITADPFPQFTDRCTAGCIQGDGQQGNRHQDAEQKKEKNGSFCVPPDIKPCALCCRH